MPYRESFAVSPAFTYITPNLLDYMRAEVRRFLLHTYTRISRLPMTPTDVDAWGQQDYQYAEPVVGLPCFYDIKEQAVVTPQGVTTLERSVLIFAYDDLTDEGDIVQNVVTQDGIVLFPGPSVIEHVSLRDPNVHGGLFVEASLREVEYVLNPRA